MDFKNTSASLNLLRQNHNNTKKGERFGLAERTLEEDIKKD
jgi:hypothetical protein